MPDTMSLARVLASIGTLLVLVIATLGLLFFGRLEVPVDADGFEAVLRMSVALVAFPSSIVLFVYYWFRTIRSMFSIRFRPEDQIVWRALGLVKSPASYEYMSAESAAARSRFVEDVRGILVSAVFMLVLFVAVQ